MLNKVKLLSLITYIFFVSALLRLSFLPYLASWSHDNSRDVIKIYKLFTYGEIIWRGPVFSVVWGFLSPIYYYILTPFYWLTDYHPLTPGSFSLFLNFITLLILYYVVKRIYGYKAAVIACLIYGLSFVVIKEGAYGLNPNLVPPFTLIFIYSIYQILVANKPLYLILLAFSSSMLISFHPGGVFALPSLLVLYFIYKPKFKIKTWLTSIFTFGLFGVIPYAVVEKKFDFWNVRQIIKYIKEGSPESLPNVTFIQSVFNFIYIYLKNISLVLFGNSHIYFVVLSIFLITLLFWIVKKKKIKKLKVDKVMFVVLLSYLTVFGLILTFKSYQTLTWWFHTSLIPITIIILSRYLVILSNKVLYSLAFLFAVTNLHAFYSYVPPLDTHYASKHAVEIIKKDSEGRDFDIYGSDERPINYLVWYYEDTTNLKDKYYAWIKWDKKKTSNLVYYLQSYDSLNSFEDMETEIKNKHGLMHSEYLGSVGDSVKIYKVY